MALIEKNGVNFSKEVKNLNVWHKFESNGREFKVIKYFKSQPAEDELEVRPISGNQTQIIVRWRDTKKEEAFVTAVMRLKYCPDYKTTPHRNGQAKFGYEHLELASQQQLLDLRDAIHDELARREKAVSQEIAALEARLKALKGE